MPTANFSVSIEINASPEVVFSCVADLARHGEWSANPLRIEALSSGPLAVGSRYRSTAEFGGREIHAEFQVTEYEPPRRFGFAGKDTTGKYEHLFTLQPQSGGTLLKRTVRFDLTPGQWLMFQIILYPIRLPAARKALKLLKARLEQGAA